MAVHLQIPYETLVELVQQLSDEQQQDLLRRLQRAQHRELTVDEKMRLLRSVQFHREVKEEPSPRREDWYDDGGR